MAHEIDRVSAADALEDHENAEHILRDGRRTGFFVIQISRSARHRMPWHICPAGVGPFANEAKMDVVSEICFAIGIVRGEKEIDRIDDANVADQENENETFSGIASRRRVFRFRTQEHVADREDEQYEYEERYEEWRGEFGELGDAECDPGEPDIFRARRFDEAGEEISSRKLFRTRRRRPSSHNGRARVSWGKAEKKRRQERPPGSHEPLGEEVNEDDGKDREENGHDPRRLNNLIRIVAGIVEELVAPSHSPLISVCHADVAFVGKFGFIKSTGSIARAFTSGGCSGFSR